MMMTTIVPLKDAAGSLGAKRRREAKSDDGKAQAKPASRSDRSRKRLKGTAVLHRHVRTWSCPRLDKWLVAKNSRMDIMSAIAEVSGDLDIAILKMLPMRDVVSLRRTCRALHFMIGDEYVMKSLLLNAFRGRPSDVVRQGHLRLQLGPSPAFKASEAFGKISAASMVKHYKDTMRSIRDAASTCARTYKFVKSLEDMCANYDPLENHALKSDVVSLAVLGYLDIQAHVFDSLARVLASPSRAAVSKWMVMVSGLCLHFDQRYFVDSLARRCAENISSKMRPWPRDNPYSHRHCDPHAAWLSVPRLGLEVATARTATSIWLARWLLCAQHSVRTANERYFTGWSELEPDEDDTRLWDAYMSRPRIAVDNIRPHLDHMAIIIATVSSHMTSPHMYLSTSVWSLIPESARWSKPDADSKDYVEAIADWACNDAIKKARRTDKEMLLLAMLHLVRAYHAKDARPDNVHLLCGVVLELVASLLLDIKTGVVCKARDQVVSYRLPSKVDAIIKHALATAEVVVDRLAECVMDTISLWRNESLIVRLLEINTSAGLAKLYTKFTTSSASRDRAATATALLFFEDLAKVKNATFDREIVDKAIESIKFAVKCHDACTGNVWN
ncbi:hypothetical protein ml_491 [Mollivirus sibericum]|uniref:hypothetical protein n=1 Tax=Mollivirus sibericum TaxID=1678078 RepID=UPI0006B2E3A2|nr:hypothetical protein ml_491 [Mollivirus sibericum]ALD62293.1 hypothetical protein ml_491 [Mollivirus sibericum]